LAGSAGPWITLVDGLGVLGPPDGTTLDALGYLVIPIGAFPVVPLGVDVALQAAYLQPNGGLGLTWTRVVGL
jgi:hypothetical protein